MAPQFVADILVQLEKDYFAFCICFSHSFLFNTYTQKSKRNSWSLLGLLRQGGSIWESETQLQQREEDPDEE